MSIPLNIMLTPSRMKIFVGYAPDFVNNYETICAGMDLKDRIEVIECYASEHGITMALDNRFSKVAFGTQYQPLPFEVERDRAFLISQEGKEFVDNMLHSNVPEHDFIVEKQRYYNQ